MKRVLVFCSNPVNGGTAEIFSEMCKSIQDMEVKDWIIFPCTNKGNTVEKYKTVKDITYLPVQSMNQYLGTPESTTAINRIKNRLKRDCQYRLIKKENIRIMQDFLRKERIDAVVIHNGGYIGDDLCNQMLHAADNVRIAQRIMVFHNSFKKSLFRVLWHMPYDAMINKRATDTVTVSGFTRDRLLSSSILRRDMQVIYNGITFDDLESIEDKKRKLCYMEGVVHIGVVGNFQSNKGQYEAIKAIAEAAKKIKRSIQVFFIGNNYDQAYFDACSELIDKLGLSDFTKIHQGIYNAREYFCMFDITLVSSLHSESFGLISIESMRAGVPIVAFACEGITEVICDGEDGYLVTVGDSMKMADKIVTLVNNVDLRKEMGRQARSNYYRKYTRDIMGRQYIALLNK